ncbi:MAG: hypothetical protein Q8R82_21350, partial [Hyphomonadaceae bacterium]|nr:hypothetical protein [Hyphomonadaceae bacterium]
REPTPAEKGDPGEPGTPGRDGLDASEDQIAKAVTDYMAANPPAPGKDGEPGRDGKDAEVDYDILASEVAKHIPTPENGKDADPEVVAFMVAEAVAKAVSALPVAKDGVGLAGALIDRTGNLIVTMTDGTTRELGLVVGKDGEPGLPGANGSPGKDGFSLEDFDAEVTDGGRTMILSFVAGDTKHTSEHQLDTILDRGVFKVGSTYQSGDAVTWDGSLWIAQAKTKSKPGENAEWRLAAKRGQNGKDVNESALKVQIEEHVRAAEERLAARIEAGFKRRDG